MPCSRYDYEGVESEKADAVMNHVREVIKSSPPGTKFGAFELQLAGESSTDKGQVLDIEVCLQLVVLLFASLPSQLAALSGQLDRLLPLIIRPGALWSSC